ncbi:MAG TPA: SDR family NAD(P)-dependent oxidoreductase [Bryobacteraceae bacterium]|nr:SDR family NAD(P)-dependent oxidoreductase [Bryobacteraceae bacterium]
MNELSDKVVLITGANGGLGSAITRAFLEAGAIVVGTARRITDSDFAHPRFTGVSADLTAADAAGRLVETVLTRFERIDALVHVLGGFAGGGAIHETTGDTWDAMMNLNLRTAFYTLRAVIPPMRQAGRGRIVAIGSRAAAEPQPNIGAYSASKAALVSLVRTVALENKDHGITANMILPGTIDTEANRKAEPHADHSRWIAPERLAALAMFLISDAGAQITGAAIPVYGPDA